MRRRRARATTTTRTAILRDPAGRRLPEDALRMGLTHDVPDGALLDFAGALDSTKPLHRVTAWVMLVVFGMPVVLYVLRLLVDAVRLDGSPGWVEGDLQDAEAHLVGGALAPHDVALRLALERREPVAQPLHVLAGDLDRVAGRRGAPA